jgi:hypothetical protein
VGDCRRGGWPSGIVRRAEGTLRTGRGAATQDFGAQQMIMTEHAATQRNSPISW